MKPARCKPDCNRSRSCRSWPPLFSTSSLCFLSSHFILFYTACFFSNSVWSLETPANLDHDSYEFNYRQFQLRQQQQQQLGTVDHFVTSENFGNDELFDSVKQHRISSNSQQTTRQSERQKSSPNSNSKLNSPVVNGNSHAANKHLPKETPFLPISSSFSSSNSSPPKCTFLLPPNTSSNFTSPNYPNFIFTNSSINCLYRIPKLDASTCALKLTFLDFTVGESLNSKTSKSIKKSSSKIKSEFGPLPSTDLADCQNSFLEFNDRQRFCGRQWTGKSIVLEASSEEAEFIFRYVVSDGNSEPPSRGFHLSYRPLSGSCEGILQADGSTNLAMLASPNSNEKPRCEHRHTELTFDLQSPGFPANYSNNLDCLHYVVRESDKVCGLELRFLSFNLEPSEGCAYDFLAIDGEAFCGRLSPGSRNIFRFTEEVKSISFQTDAKGTAGGFNIRARQLTDCENAFIPAENRLTGAGLRTQKCNFITSELEGTLTSLHFPASYPDDLLCAYTIEKPSKTLKNYCSVNLHFTTFDLAPSTDCVEDFLELQNQRFCGSQLNSTSRVVSFNEDGSVKFLFRTDGSGSLSSKGFSLNYTAVECLDGNIQSTTESSTLESSTVSSDSSSSLIGTSESKTSVKTIKAVPGRKKVPSNSSKNPKTSEKGNRNGIYYYRDPCFKVFNTKRFNITSEVVNGSYLGNSDCLYTIRKSFSEVCYLEITFRHFDLEASPDCQYDYVEVGNAVRLCGTLQKETSRIYRFEGAEMYVNFHTDSSTERSGFRMEVEQLRCEGERIVRDEQKQEQELEKEAQDQHKQQHEQEKNKEVVQEKKDNALDQTESSLNPQQQQQQQQQQQNILQQQESSSSEFDLYPVPRKPSLSSSSYSSQTPTQTSSSFERADFFCSKIFQEREFFIHSPGYPSHYSADLDCLYMVRPYRPTVCQLELNFDHFELQPFDFAKTCLKTDFLDVDGKEQFCGKMAEATSKVYPFLNQTFFLHFHSDSFRTSFDRGFRLYVRQIDCGDSGFNTPSSRIPPPLPPSITNDKTGKSFPSPGFSRCNKIFTGSAFEIRSPLYPTTYLSNSFCQYRIVKLRSTDSLRICHLEVVFKDFDLQDSSESGCSKDYVSFNGVKVCGTIMRDSVRLFPFFDSEFLITFSSDRIVNGRGFYLQIRQNECGGSQISEDSDSKKLLPTIQQLAEGFKLHHDHHHHQSNSFFSNFQILQANQLCQQVHSSAVFDLESPNYPHYYLPGLACTYHIRKRSPSVCQLEIHFVDFDIEPSVGCSEDYLLLEGVQYCNRQRPSTLMTLSFMDLEKRILFRSSELRTRKGFLLQARQIDCSLPKVHLPSGNPVQTAAGIFPPEKFIFLPSLPSICEICVTEVTGALQSYDYPNFYPPNLNCTYRVTALPGNCMVQLKFEQFDFDYSPECGRDYLEVNGVRYCGSQLKGVSMLLLNKRKEDLSIRMVSHSRGAIVKPSFRGFRASYTQLPCLDAPTEVDPSSSKNRKPLLPPSKTSQQTPSSTPSNPVFVPPPNSKPLMPTKTPSLPPNELIPENIFCDQSFTSERFEIKSPGYPYRYFDSLNCAYQIVKSSERVCRLSILFNYFNVVGEDGACSGDYLDVGREKVCGVLERFTKKEIPFAHGHLMLTFHTNPSKTANGFHLSLEQVDCYPGGDQHPPPPPSFDSSITTKTHQEPSSGKSHPRPPSHYVQQKHHQQQEHFRYDDDETEFDQSRKTVSKATPTSTTISQMSTSTPTTSSSTTPVSTTTKTLPPSKVDISPHVVYEPSTSTTPQPFEQQPQQQQIEQQIVMMYDPRAPARPIDERHPSTPSFPLRYFSRNITVVNGGKTTQQPSNPQIPGRFEQQRWEIKGGKDDLYSQETPSTTAPSQPRQPRPSSSICSQMFVEQSFFELTSSDLLSDSNLGTKSGGSSSSATCQLHVKKAKSNVCQLDIAFVRYWNNSDTTCGSQYLSVDGERICGFVPAGTIKKFWFVRPDLYLFVKLLKEEVQRSSYGDQPFLIKARQVECATNLDQQEKEGLVQQQQIEQTPPFYRPKSPKYAYYDQQQQQLLEDNKLFPDKNQNFYYQQDATKIPPPSKPPMDTLSSPPSQDESTFHYYCDLISSELQYKISSPNGMPGPHKCRYTVRRNSDRVCAIELKFHMFRLEEETSNLENSMSRCRNEYLKVDGGKICGAFPVGHERRYYFLAGQQEKYIYYTSNRTSNPGDFLLEVKQLEDCSKPMRTNKPSLQTPTICDVSSRSLRGSLKSPNYPAPYDDATRCTYRISAASPDYCTLKLIIKDLDIEANRGPAGHACEKDLLELSADMKLCGRDLAKREYTLPFESINGQREIQMRFTTDSTGNGRGFSMDYSQELCPSAMNPPTKSGISGGRYRPQSPIMAGKTQFIPMHQTDSNSLGRNPMRPSYPPNYVSKAHLLKSMDRGQFIKLMLLEEEREKMRLSIKNNGTSKKLAENEVMMATPTTTSTTLTSTLMTTMTTMASSSTLMTSTEKSVDGTSSMMAPTTTQSPPMMKMTTTTAEDGSESDSATEIVTNFARTTTSAASNLMELSPTTTSSSVDVGMMV